MVNDRGAKRPSEDVDDAPPSLEMIQERIDKSLDATATAAAANQDGPPNKKVRLGLSGDPDFQPTQDANGSRPTHGHSSTAFVKVANAKPGSKAAWLQANDTSVAPEILPRGPHRILNEAVGAVDLSRAGRCQPENPESEKPAESVKFGRDGITEPDKHNPGAPATDRDAASFLAAQQQRAGQMLWARAHWEHLAAVAAQSGHTAADAAKEGSAAEADQKDLTGNSEGALPRKEGAAAGTVMPAAGSDAAPGSPAKEARAGQPARPPMWNGSSELKMVPRDGNSREQQMGYYEQMMAHQEFMAQQMAAAGSSTGARPPQFWQLSTEQMAAMYSSPQHAEILAQAARAGGPAAQPRPPGQAGQAAAGTYPSAQSVVFVGSQADLQNQPPIQTTAPVPGDFPVIPVAAYHINRPGSTAVQQFSNTMPSAVVDEQYMPPMNSMSYRLELRPDELTQCRDMKSTFSLVGESTTSRRYQFRCPDLECPHNADGVTTPWLMSTSNKFRCPSAHCKAKKQKNNHTIPAHVMRIHLIDVRMARSLGY